MATMQLGTLKWRVDPNSVDWSFQIDTTRINTLGGQVVQLVGSTLSDLTISGDFGQDHKGKKVSWQLASAFHSKIQTMMDAQAQPAKSLKQSQSIKPRAGSVISDAGPVHDPWPLTYNDGRHKWSFKVLIKAMEDNDGSALVHHTGKFAYKYKLTLFIVQSDSEAIRKVAADYFLSRISEGLGWKQSGFNGPATAKLATQFIQANGGTITAFLDKVLTGGDISDPGPTQITSNPATHPKTGGTGPTKNKPQV